jgi:hypothetical protein
LDWISVFQSFLMASNRFDSKTSTCRISSNDA